MKRIIAFLSILGFFGFGFAADLGGFTIGEYNIDIVLQTNGEMIVHETIPVDFSEDRHGIYREIPINDPWDITISDESVADYNYTSYYEGANFIFKIGDPAILVKGLQTYKINYTVQGGIRNFSGYQELYRNLIGTKWNTTIDQTTFKIEWDNPTILNSGDRFVYHGINGSKNTDDIDIEVNPTNIVGHLNKKLEPNQALTIGIKFPENTFSISPNESFQNTVTNILDSSGAFSTDDYLWLGFLILSLPLITIIIMYFVRRKYGKDEEHAAMPLYYPPKDTDPVLAGYLIDDRLDNNDMFSLIYFRAAKGYLTIKEEESKLWFFKRRSYTMTKIKDFPDNMTDYEKRFFDIFFPGDNKTFELGKLSPTYKSDFNKIKKLIEEHIKKEDFYTAESLKLKKRLLIGGIAGFVLTGFVGVISVTLVLPLNLCFIAIIIFSIFMAKKTKKGATLYHQIKGFKLFLKTVETPKLKQMLKEDSAYFDKILPYAVVFGLGTKFLEKCEGLLSEPPHRYIGTIHGDIAHGLQGTIIHMSSNYASAFGSSGGGGGGSSGGGGGGGGGGSW